MSKKVHAKRHEAVTPNAIPPAAASPKKSYFYLASVFLFEGVLLALCCTWSALRGDGGMIAGLARASIVLYLECTEGRDGGLPTFLSSPLPSSSSTKKKIIIIILHSSNSIIYILLFLLLFLKLKRRFADGLY